MLGSTISVRANTGFEIYPDFDGVPGMKVNFQNSSGDILISGSAGDNVILFSDAEFKIRSDDFTSIFPDYDGNPTKELKIYYSATPAALILDAINANLGFEIDGNPALTILATSVQSELPLRFDNIGFIDGHGLTHLPPDHIFRV